MNIKCYVIVDAWLGLIVVTGCEVGIVLFTQTMSAIKLYPVQVFVSNTISILRGEGGVTNEDVIGLSVTSFFIQSFWLNKILLFLFVIELLLLVIVCSSRLF